MKQLIMLRYCTDISLQVKAPLGARVAEVNKKQWPGTTFAYDVPIAVAEWHEKAEQMSVDKKLMALCKNDCKLFLTSLLDVY